MQSVADAFSVEAVDRTRKIAQSVQVAWKKDFRTAIKFFTIGVSTIGGNDLIPGPAGVVSAWNKYLYEDESARVTAIRYERELNTPTGGVTKALAEVDLDNTSERYTPRYAGGTSAIFTAVSKPRRPIVITAGFNYNGADYTLPQFVGVTTKVAQVDRRNRTARLVAADFLDFLQNKIVEDTAIFTSQRTDQIIASVLAQQGYSTAQYDLDTGISVVPFAMFPQGGKFGDVINQLVQAENGLLWQDEEGTIKFQSRTAWNNYPYFNVQRVIATSQVINSEIPADDHIINTVEVKASPRVKQPAALIWTLPLGIAISPSTDKEVWVNFTDPLLQITAYAYAANTVQDGSGSAISISLKSITSFTNSAKLVFTNNTALAGFITQLDITGRTAKSVKDIYVRAQDDSSVTAYEERPLSIQNDYIQTDSWANSLAQMILNDYSEPENLQNITIRAMPELQLGDLVSWQGRYWRIFGIKTQLDPSIGFVQDLKLLQRAVVNYFRIGISTIGGSDKIAP